MPEGLPEKVCHGAPFLVTVQEFTLVTVAAIVVEPPETTRSGEDVIETVGTSTVTVAIFELAVPPVPMPVQYI